MVCVEVGSDNQPLDIAGVISLSFSGRQGGSAFGWPAYSTVR